MAKQRARKSAAGTRGRSAARKPAASRGGTSARSRAGAGEKRQAKRTAAPRGRRRTAEAKPERGSARRGLRGREASPTAHRSAIMLTDHDQIRWWAEARGGHPACVRGTGKPGDVGMIRIDFPGYSGERSLEPIDWDEWFEKFDASDLGLLVLPERPDEPGGEKSRFNKLIRREAYRYGEEGE